MARSRQGGGRGGPRHAGGGSRGGGPRTGGRPGTRVESGRPRRERGVSGGGRSPGGRASGHRAPSAGPRQAHGGHGGPPHPSPPLAPVPPHPPRARLPAGAPRPALPAPGAWAWACRAGFEPHLYEALAWQGRTPTPFVGGLVLSSHAGRELSPPAFARTGFRVDAAVPDAAGAAAAAHRLLGAAAAAPVCLHAWVPDTDEGNRLSPALATLEAELASVVGARRAELEAARRRDGLLLQACLVPGGAVLLGLQPAADALSPAPGGRMRMWRESGTSRASLKVEEALEWLGQAPGKGEHCVDLGAAPGGWTERLLARGARVVAVDPARMAPHLAGHPRMQHAQESAFTYVPDAPVDWLFCDMAWRPLEVAALLARWGRQRWATWLVANIKLPMHDKNPVLHRVRHVLESHGGWQRLQVRQLYHDRDEVTVTAVRPPGG
jgi:23S rRNA (cytidine2498-2'-O)-methyltransferase